MSITAGMNTNYLYVFAFIGFATDAVFFCNRLIAHKFPRLCLGTTHDVIVAAITGYVLLYSTFADKTFNHDRGLIKNHTHLQCSIMDKIGFRSNWDGSKTRTVRCSFRSRTSDDVDSFVHCIFNETKTPYCTYRLFLFKIVLRVRSTRLFWFFTIYLLTVLR